MLVVVAEAVLEKVTIKFLLDTEKNVVTSWGRGMPAADEVNYSYLTDEEHNALLMLHFYLLNYRNGAKSLSMDFLQFKRELHELMDAGLDKVSDCCKSGRTYTNYCAVLRRVFENQNACDKEKITKLRELVTYKGYSGFVFKNKAWGLAKWCDAYISQHGGEISRKGIAVTVINHNSSFDDYIMGVDPVSFNHKEFSGCFIRYSVSAYDSVEDVRTGFKMYYRQIGMDALRRFRKACTSRGAWRNITDEDFSRLKELSSAVYISNIRLLVKSREVVVTLDEKQ